MQPVLVGMKVCVHAYTHTQVSLSVYNETKREKLRLVLQKCRLAGGTAQGLGFVSSCWRQVTLKLRTLRAAAPDITRCCCSKPAVIPEQQASSVLSFVLLGREGTNAGILCEMGPCGWLPQDDVIGNDTVPTGVSRTSLSTESAHGAPQGTEAGTSQRWLGGLQQRFGCGSILSSSLSSFGEAILVPTPCLGFSSCGNK